MARAVSPPPDGGYANQNTAEGTDALFGLTSGLSNTALGYQALHANTTGQSNTAAGSDEQGRPYTVRYDAVNAMLLNEFLKKHRQAREREGKIEKLEATVAQLESLLSRRGAEIQRMTDEIVSAEAATANQ